MSELGYLPDLDTPESLPGYGMDARVPGATVTVGAPRIPGTDLHGGGANATGLFSVFDGNPSGGTDSASAEMSPVDTAKLDSANTAMSTNAIKGMQDAVSRLRGQQPQQPPPQAGQQQGRSSTPIRASWSQATQAGYLAANVSAPSDAGLLDALQSAASRSGPQAALMSPTVMMQL